MDSVIGVAVEINILIGRGYLPRFLFGIISRKSVHAALCIICMALSLAHQIHNRFSISSWFKISRANVFNLLFVQSLKRVDCVQCICVNPRYNMKFYVLACLLCTVISDAKSYRVSEDAKEPHVKTPLGQIRGSILTSRLNKTIYSFRGIRYGKAPVGNLRFKPPVPVSEWTGIYDATKDPPACPQPGRDDISEDCLFVNVFTTKLKCSKNSLKPVMVFFHPGGFYEGSCSSAVYGPQYLLDEDVVLVVPNFRLASLGFLSTGTKDAPGNNGMKDQVAVLKWVKNNIASFCGDPSQVTIFGYSAGGLSITAHLVSPMSRGLFHRAIAMSGSIFGNLPIYSNQLRLAEKQARLLNCSDSSPAEIISCLNTKSAKEISDTYWSFDEFLYDPIWIWTPVVEPDFGQERFLTEDPVESLKKRNIADVPIILGITTDEFGRKSFEIVENQTVLESYDKDFLHVWPIIYSYERKPPLSENISKGLRKFYFPNGINNSTRQGIADLYADGVIGFSVNRAVKLLSEYSSSDIYYYLFNYHGRYTHAYYPGTNNTVPYGVAHHDDLLYLFYVSVMTPLFDKAPEDNIVDKMTGMWSNFAKTGNPNLPDGTSQTPSSITWPIYNKNTELYMDIDSTSAVKEKLFEERYEVWDRLIPV